MSRGRPKTTDETKSKRISLLIKPSTYEAMGKIVYINRDSINGLVNDFFDKYVENHTKEIKEYDEIMAEGSA